MRNIFDNISRISGAAMLQFQSGSSYSATEKAAERFVRTARVLPEGGLLVLQIRTESSGEHKASVSSFPHDAVTLDDYDWIFRQCAAASAADKEAVREIFEEGRKVYRILPDQDAPAESSSFRSSYYFDDYDDLYSDHFREMFSLLSAEDAVITVTTGAEGSSGMILISLPGTMTLRMRSSVTMAVPCTAVEEIDPGQDPDSVTGKISESVLRSFLERLFRILPRDCRTDRQDSCETITDEFPETFDEGSGETEDTGSFSAGCSTPIDKLELSLRAYNCLKRAGIHTVEQLRTLSDDDLMQIRNLGRKSIEEIKQRLEENSGIGTASPLEKADPMLLLDSLIGLDGVKQQIRKITAFAKLRREMLHTGRKDLSAALNMEFVGNPGTAKTTVARITATILHDAGLISDDRIIEVGRSDLVARYEGQTAARVRDIFQSAKGRVLFIDEAYSLLEEHHGNYGDEAISTIVQEMENRRDDTVVIFAGYPDKMEEFFGRNPGLRSRVPFRLEFSDYSSDELVRIAELEAGNRGFSIDPEAFRKLRNICAEAAFCPELGNGRFCRNLIENAVMNYASRIYGEAGNDHDIDFLLREDDLISPASGGTGVSGIIGFAA